MLLREIFVPPPAWHYRGVGMPRCAEFYTQKPARRKASPGGEAGSPQGLTDEVEAIVHHHESVQNCYLRPHPSRFWRDTFPSRGRLWSVQTGNPYRPSSVCPYGQPLSRGMTATGSHIHFYSLSGAKPPGERISLPRRAFTSIFAAQMLEVGGRGVPRPYSASPGDIQEFGSVHPLRHLR